MGKILVVLRYVFLIYSVDISEKRKHINVTRKVAGYKRSCKFWIEPEVELEENKRADFSDNEIREIKKLIQENKQLILQQLELFYQGHPVKSIKK